MKIFNIYTLLVVSLLVLTFSGCGEDSAKFGSAQEQTILQQGVAQVVESGDKLIKHNDNTTIEVTHEPDSNIKKVILLNGSATLIKGSYEVTN